MLDIHNHIRVAICTVEVKMNKNYFFFKKFFHKIFKKAFKKKANIPIEKFLVGDQGGLTATKLSLLTGNWLLPSTSILKSPHIELIQLYESEGRDLFNLERFMSTSYFKLAFDVMAVTGHWFGAKNFDGIREVAIDFIKRYLGINQGRPNRPGQSNSGAPILVRPIKYSSYYQIIDGHHRLAIWAKKGKLKIPSIIVAETTLTPIQSLLLNVAWVRGRKEIYQPLPCPECQESWTLIRRCTDRLRAILTFLNKFELHSCSYLDVGSYFGWFVWQMLLKGYDAYGIEIDPVAVVIGAIAYNLDIRKRIKVGNCYFVLKEDSKKYDIISCLSVLHHFVLGKGVCSAEDFIRLLDIHTDKILFLETGQGSENWFKSSLAIWTPDYIEEWVLKNTSFNKVERIHVDQDNRPPYEGNYGRTLFAFYRG